MGTAMDSSTEIYQHALGNLTRDRRKALGMTQTQLGQRLGWAQERVSILEHGTYGMPSLSQLSRLAHALEMSLGEVLHAMGFEEIGGSETSVSPILDRARLDELNRRVSHLHDQMQAVTSHLNDAEEQLYRADTLRASIREQRARMADLLSACRPESPGRPISGV